MTRDEFASLALSYLEEVTAYARRLCRSEWDADDLVQAAFEQAFHKWEALSEPARCRAWLFRIARNLHIDRLRQSAARSELRLVHPSDAVAPEPSVPAETVERLSARELEAALVRLPEDQREALLLCDLWGFRYEEIAEITHVAIGTVRSRISRARSHLAQGLLAARKHGSQSGGRS
jgi:RNA polymerase sigma-70 factor, ECF subfamily